MASDRPKTKVLLVSDAQVASLYNDRAIAALRSEGIECETAVVPAGEDSKSLTQASELYDRLSAIQLGRDGVLLSLGGGVISDLTGFVAATWLRGIPWIACPTSLEGAIDAAIGGKTAINHAAGKNLIGAFHPPSDVVIDPLCLQTLPQRDLIAGLAESIKHALIEDEPFLAWQEAARTAILACDPPAMEALMARNITIKMDIVARDYRETAGERARLNFGHTLGHAIEASCGYALRHGECVALGMTAAARMSHALGLLSAEDRERVERAISAFGLPLSWNRLADAGAILSFLVSDKKVAGARLRWVLLAGIGRTVLRDDVPADVVHAALASLRS